MSYRAPLFRWLRHWHARVGVVAALFFLFLVVSGIALNHTDALKLDQRKLSAAWLTRWYGLHAEVPSQGFKLGERYLTWDEEKWALDAQIIAAKQAQPIGAACAGEVCYVATREVLFVFAPDGKLIDKVSGETLPRLPLQRLAADGARVVLGSEQGNFASTDGADWTPFGAVETWSLPVALPPETAAAIGPLYAPVVDGERVLLDLHSGRLFGRYGPFIVDAAALALLALALSGVWMYWRAARVQRQRDRR